MTLAGSAISNLHRPAGASIIDLSPLAGDFAAAAVAQLDLAEMTDDAGPVWLLLDYVGLEVQRPRRIGAAISPQ